MLGKSLRANFRTENALQKSKRVPDLQRGKKPGKNGGGKVNG